MGNPIALVTGASRGIGLDIAHALAQMNYELILVARDEEKLLSVCADIEKKYGVNSRGIAVDLSNTELAIEKLENQINNIGRIDIVVNCAGIFLDDGLEPHSENLSKMLDINVIAAETVSNICIPWMKRHRSGYIFNIASITGVKPYKGISNYSASKYALVGYSLCLAKTLKEYGIKVTVICPDVVDTDMSAMAPIPAERKIRPDDIAKAIAFVLSLSPAACIEQLTIGR